ncbi:SCO family protein [Akkermansiaceae bacterium]|nr:SCO family protein [Akkermansiaceae bacterium]
MTKRNTIILFYCGVALVCAAILSLVNFLIVPNIRANSQKTESFQNVGQQREKEWYPIEKDLVATNQAGASVRLSDLRGKVWVVAEFFAICPHCAERNGAELRAIYDEFREHPDFHMVCISVDPERDNVERLGEYAKALGAETEDWWFLNAGEEKATHEYMEKTLKFLGVRERTDPADIEANGRFLHDLGLMVVDRDFNVIGKWSLAAARSEEGRALDPGQYERDKAEMAARIRAELAKGGETTN